MLKIIAVSMLYVLSAASAASYVLVFYNTDLALPVAVVLGFCVMGASQISSEFHLKRTVASYRRMCNGLMEGLVSADKIQGIMESSLRQAYFPKTILRRVGAAFMQALYAVMIGMFFHLNSLQLQIGFFGIFIGALCWYLLPTSIRPS